MPALDLPPDAHTYLAQRERAIGPKPPRDQHLDYLRWMVRCLDYEYAWLMKYRWGKDAGT